MAAVTLKCAGCKTTFDHEGRGRRPIRCGVCRGLEAKAKGKRAPRAKPEKAVILPHLLPDDRRATASAGVQMTEQEFELAIIRVTGALNGLSGVLEKVLREVA